MSDPVRIAMLGSGFLAEFYMQGLANVNGQRVVLNYSRTAAHAAALPTPAAVSAASSAIRQCRPRPLRRKSLLQKPAAERPLPDCLARITTRQKTARSRMKSASRR